MIIVTIVGGLTGLGGAVWVQTSGGGKRVARRWSW